MTDVDLSYKNPEKLSQKPQFRGTLSIRTPDRRPQRHCTDVGYEYLQIMLVSSLFQILSLKVFIQKHH